MNKINSLLDENFALNLFKKEILPLYPEYSAIDKINIQPIKNNIWSATYHVVIKYRAVFSDGRGKTKILSLYCTAHSNESRLDSFEASTFLWQNGFNRGNLTMPRPLFYSEEFNGFFYQGIKGDNLYHLIRLKNLPAVENVTVKAAAWFAKLHRLPADKARNFNCSNSRIETVVPGMNCALAKVEKFYPRYYEICRLAYEIADRREKEFFSSTGRRWLIHGDAHPENVISVSKNKIGLIDFTDICLSDFARDIGTFLQQLGFMAKSGIKDPTRVEKLKQLFLNRYLENAGLNLDESLRKRIAAYYQWTALRTAIYFLLKEKSEPERAHGLLIKISRDFKLNIII